MTCNLKVAKVWAVKEQFRSLIQQEYAGDMEANLYFYMWFDDAIALKSSAVEAVAFMFKRHLKGIVRAMVTKASNGKAERMNGSIQEIRTELSEGGMLQRRDLGRLSYSFMETLTCTNPHKIL